MVGGTESQPGSPPGKQPDCVLWRPAGLEAPARLLASLKRRGVSITDCTSPMLAMATACRLARVRREAADSPPVAGEDAVILLLVHPTKLDMAPDVVEALEATVGAVACWRYDEEDETQLRAVNPEDLAAWRAAREPDLGGEAGGDTEPLRPVILNIPAASVSPRRAPGAAETASGPRMAASSGPTLRLVGDEPEAQAEADEEGDDAEMPEEPDSGALLTEEELMMLLSSDPTEWEAEPEGDDE